MKGRIWIAGSVVTVALAVGWGAVVTTASAQKKYLPEASATNYNTLASINAELSCIRAELENRLAPECEIGAIGIYVGTDERAPDLARAINMLEKYCVRFNGNGPACLTLPQMKRTRETVSDALTGCRDDDAANCQALAVQLRNLESTLDINVDASWNALRRSCALGRAPACDELANTTSIKDKSHNYIARIYFADHACQLSAHYCTHRNAMRIHYKLPLSGPHMDKDIVERKAGPTTGRAISGKWSTTVAFDLAKDGSGSGFAKIYLSPGADYDEILQLLVKSTFVGAEPGRVIAHVRFDD